MDAAVAARVKINETAPVKISFKRYCAEGCGYVF